MDRKNDSNNFFIFLLLGFLSITTFVVLTDSKVGRLTKNQKTEPTHGYSKDSQNVYLNGNKLENVDVTDFLILDSNFARDNKWAYYADGGMRSIKINNADPKTFEFLGGNYARDKSRFFCCQTECEVMREVKGDFKVLNENGYAKDNFNVYRGCDKLEGIDINSFEPMGANYYLDKRFVYFVDEVVLKADSDSFKVVNDIYGVDKNGIYYGSMKMLDADPASFKPLGDYYSKDKTFVYFQGKVLGSGVDVDSFETLENSFARDKKYVYYFGKKMAGLDRDSFKVLDIEYGRDKNGVYYNGIKMDKVDVVTFVVLSNFFAKDVNFVYRYGQPANFDAPTFAVLKDGSYRDKNGVYRDKTMSE